MAGKGGKIKVYKFRELGSAEDLERGLKIIETGEFWCSKFSELNDPMEGVFNAYSLTEIDKVYSEKNKMLVCSFSGEKGFKNPLMWGYYACGFRGYVIEAEIDEKGMEKMTYSDKRVTVSRDREDYEATVKKILLRKSPSWKHEDEYRFFCTTQKWKIGEIKCIYFGIPYFGMQNENEIREGSKSLLAYHERMGRLKAAIPLKSGISYRDVYIKNGKVEINDASVASPSVLKVGEK